MKKEISEGLYHIFYDELTGVLNRNAFVSSLQELAERDAVEHKGIGLLLVDIDFFKKINEAQGMIFGDDLVQTVGFRLKSLEDDDTVIGRMETDIFAISYVGGDEKALNCLFEKVADLFEEPVKLMNGKKIKLQFTGGGCFLNESSINPFQLIKYSELSLIEAKNTKRGSLVVFNEQILEAFNQATMMEDKLKQAMDQNSFVLYYQPQFDSKTGKLRGAEALVRLVDDEGTIVSPASFIPIAEKNEDILPIGMWVLEEAMATIARWEREFNFEGIISVNLSAKQIMQNDIAQTIISLMEKYAIKPKNLELEITESIFIGEFEKAADCLKRLRKMGIRISLDDFGTGYSSLSYLKELPIDTLKIDKSFVDTIENSEATEIITESIVNMVKRLGLSTVAEGVENESQYEILKRMQCDLIQGYLFGKPMPVSEFERVCFG